ncbi:MAG: hypothetical protein LQ338_007320 [Usnochroma carphineum]|nr:MAG: hypothetical protein LQ338_007320 [Usnochroma carphineum]
MPESISANAVWQYDYIDHYRLSEDIIDNFLREKWGRFRYYVRLEGEKYRFWVPRALDEASITSFPGTSIALMSTQEEKDELIRRRLPQM